MAARTEFYNFNMLSILFNDIISHLDRCEVSFWGCRKTSVKVVSIM